MLLPSALGCFLGVQSRRKLSWYARVGVGQLVSTFRTHSAWSVHSVTRQLVCPLTAPLPPRLLTWHCCCTLGRIRLAAVGLRGCGMYTMRFTGCKTGVLVGGLHSYRSKWRVDRAIFLRIAALKCNTCNPCPVENWAMKYRGGVGWWGHVRRVLSRRQGWVWAIR